MALRHIFWTVLLITGIFFFMKLTIIIAAIAFVFFIVAIFFSNIREGESTMKQKLNRLWRCCRGDIEDEI